jgi:hypothetical protein
MLEGHHFDAVSISVPDPEAVVHELQASQRTRRASDRDPALERARLP